MSGHLDVTSVPPGLYEMYPAAMVRHTSLGGDGLFHKCRCDPRRQRPAVAASAVAIQSHFSAAPQPAPGAMSPPSVVMAPRYLSREREIPACQKGLKHRECPLLEHAHEES